MTNHQDVAAGLGGIGLGLATLTLALIQYGKPVWNPLDNYYSTLGILAIDKTSPELAVTTIVAIAAILALTTATILHQRGDHA